MSHSAKELFQDWYGDALKRQDIPADELNARKNAINKLLKKDSYKFWVAMVMLAFGKKANDQTMHEEFIAGFKAEDENFPLQNHNLSKTLAGCLLAQKMEDESYTYLNDFIFLTVLSFAFKRKAESVILENLVTKAMTLWVASCEEQRNVTSDFKTVASIPKQTSTGFKPTNIGDPTTFGTELQPIINGLISDDKALIKGQTETFEALASIKTTLETLSEEINVLWWILTEYSHDLKLPFKKIGFPLMAIVSAKEIADLTSHLPGMGNVETLLSKTFNMTTTGKINKIALADFVKPLIENGSYTKSIADEFQQELNSVCPILYAISCVSEFGEQGWESVYKKNQDFSFTDKNEPEVLADQLYKELMLVRVFNELEQ
jgi:hypothetical protein